MSRSRPTFLALILITITLGLLTRSSLMPARGGFIATYAGDVLWATMVYFILCLVAPQWPPLKVAIYAVGFSFAIEFSQLNQQDWIVNLRQSRLGGLVLGFGFKASDLLCYTIGVLLPYVTETFLCKSKPTSV